MRKEILNPDESPPLGRYSQGIKVDCGRLLFISGQVAADPSGKVAGVGDAEVQAKRVFEKIKVVLDRAGATFDSIVKMTVYLTDMRNADAYRKVRDEYFKGDLPTSTMIEVSRLAFSNLLIEIDAVAVLP